MTLMGSSLLCLLLLLLSSFDIEQIELPEEFPDIILAEGDPLDHNRIQKILLGYIPPTIEIHGGVGLVGPTEYVSKFTTQHCLYLNAEMMFAHTK